MKIVCVSHSASLTGAPKFIFQLAKLLATKYEIILVSKRDGTLLEEVKNNTDNIEYVNINSSHEVCQTSFSERVIQAQYWLKENKPDLVYVNSAASAEWAVAARLSGVKNILHLHEMCKELNSLLRIRCITLDIMDYVDLLICASQDVKRDADGFFLTQPQNSVVVEYPFDCEAIRNLSKQLQPLPQNSNGQNIDLNKPIVCGCGVASYRKGADVFFETARQLKDIQFLWVGQWWSNAVCNNQIDQAFVSEALNNFFITNEVQNSYFYLGLADLFVLTSREDPNPLVVFEALILGKQVVCFSKTGGSRFVLDRYGYVLTGSPDTDVLASFVQKILPSDSLYRPNWLKHLPAKIEAEYSIDVVLPKFESLIQKLFVEHKGEKTLVS